MLRSIMEQKTKLNIDAWDILVNDERVALTLSLGHGKSTWEAGEVLHKAHFKYLEIQKRSRKFLEIFTNHFDKYNGLFPESLAGVLTFPFKEYLQLTMIDRMHISKAAKAMEDSSYTIASRRNKFIIREIEKLKKLNTEDSLDLYGLIMDFDRWNNFRILPVEIQEPSAFKRRNKAKDVKHLKKIISLPQFSVIKLIDDYSYNGKFDKIYVVLVSKYLSDNYQILTPKNKPITITELTSIGLYVFDTRERADEFGALVAGYFLGDSKNCKTGQLFWPEFRELSIQAVNYMELKHIHKSRTYLDQAIFNRDLVKKRKNQLTRAEDIKKFYSK